MQSYENGYPNMPASGTKQALKFIKKQFVQFLKAVFILSCAIDIINKNYLYIPNNMIKITNKLNNVYGELHIIQGDLLSMVDKAEEKVIEIFPKEYPVQAIIEAVKNAVLYREYFDLNKIIEIVIDENKIVISSPGEFIDENNKGEKTIYNKRNIWLYEKLITLDDKKRFLNSGRGFTIIKEAFKGKGKVKFVNSRIEHSFKVILPGIKNK